ncbi:hypothetical protein yruck0001_17650 [Yersinia ruckeri ATCC 29473]|nr:hypothetical protein yruck0001_17650 [Yersinia ruckeri ATCC 29473]
MIIKIRLANPNDYPAILPLQHDNILENLTDKQQQSSTVLRIDERPLASGALTSFVRHE